MTTFGLCLTGFFGGGGATSEASTGLGANSGGDVCVTSTWIVCGRNPGMVNVIDCGVRGSVRTQGVLQAWPCGVLASAPGGWEISCKATSGGAGGFDDNQSGIDKDMPEHPANTLDRAVRTVMELSRTRNTDASLFSGLSVGPPVPLVKAVRTALFFREIVPGI